MRSKTLLPFIISLAMTLTASPVLCEPEAAPASENSPSALRVKWYLEKTRQAYDTAGFSDKKWDYQAHKVLESAARRWSWSPRINGDEELTIMDQGKEAMNAGCRDPLVIFARAQIRFNYYREPKEIAKMQEGMADAFRKSKYSANFRCLGYLCAAQFQVMAAPDDAQEIEKAKALVEEAMALLPEAFADPHYPLMELKRVLLSAGEVSYVVYGNQSILRSRVVDLMEKSPLSKAVILAARAQLAINDGLHARGGDVASKVTPEQWRILEEQMAKGRALLKEAWEADSNEIEIAIAQLNNETHDNNGRDAMEQWFEQATKLDPDDQRAYYSKLNWLEPKWHGSIEEMVAFGRQCAAKGRWSGLIPMMLVDAHLNASKYGFNGNMITPKREYFQANPKIWDELKPIFDRYFQEPETSNYYRTQYAIVAAYCGHWKEANSTFKSMRIDLRNPNIMNDNNALDALAREAASEARKMAKAERAARVAAGKADNDDNIISARWGGGENWADVTEALKENIVMEYDFWADNDALGADPTPGWKKQLEIKYKAEGNTRRLIVHEGDKVPWKKFRVKQEDQPKPSE